MSAEVSDKAEDGKRGMCLGEFLEKHPELKEKVEEHFQKKSKKWKDEKGGEGHSKHHSHHSKSTNCTADEDCTNNTICCKTHCGAMKCKKPIFWDSDKAEDGKRGMCLGEFLEKHPDLKEKLEERFQKRSKKWKDHSHRFFNLPSCTLDEDCTKNTICCKTLRGSMKCLNPIFSEKDIKWLHKDHKEKSRNKREAEAEKDIKCLHDDDKEKSRDKREAHVKGHRKGAKHKPREGHGKRFQYEKLHHKGPIKGEAQVDETYIKQGSNRKRKGV
ncbi:hypothetical protein XELAEV_18036815mg [Xenopus laevis]|uniref:Uncharacterized protein n=1 Tax=Xenopus laevis TaxID=8355 RepID=A0A974H9T8_XENLA|nr:hypothetical protein XELAEV_18036815mg [Xenopus laevis]